MNTELCTTLGLNDYQIETLKAASTDTATATTINALLAAYQKSTITETIAYDRLLEIIIDHNSTRLAKEYRERLAAGGVVLQAVQDDPPFVYTVGLSLTLGYELIIRVPMLVQDMGRVLNAAIEFLKTHPDPDGEFSIDAFTICNSPMRLKTVVCDDLPRVLNELALMANNPVYLSIPPTEIRQLVMADSDNRLPGEYACNEDFTQELFPIEHTLH